MPLCSIGYVWMFMELQLATINWTSYTVLTRDSHGNVLFITTTGNVLVLSWAIPIFGFCRNSPNSVKIIKEKLKFLLCISALWKPENIIAINNYLKLQS